MDQEAQPEAASKDGTNDRRISFVCLLLLLIVCAVCFIPRMTNGRLRNWDEAWYAQVSRETTEQHNSLTLRWNDHNWFEKPPLTFWITGTLFHLFGESEVTARLLSVLCGAGICVTVFAWIRNIHGPFIGLIAALLLLSIPDFSRYVARGQIDAPITLLIALSLWSYQKSWCNWNWLWLCNACVGVGFMTKGSVAAFAWIIIACHACLTRRISLLVSKQFLGSLMLAIAIAFPWHAYQVQQHGNAFLSEYFGRHIGQLFTLPDVATEPAVPLPYEPFFYFRYLLTKFAVWGWLTFAILSAALIRYFRCRDEKLLLWICWFAVVFAVLSASRMKRGWYLFLLYPSLASLAATMLAEFARTRALQMRTALASVCCAMVTLGADLARPPSREFENEIASVAAKAQELIPGSEEICTLQTEFAKESVYPISARFYLARHVRIVVSLDQMQKIVTDATGATNVLLTQQSESRWRQLCAARGVDNPLLETLAQSGAIKLMRVMPSRQQAGLEKALK